MKIIKKIRKICIENHDFAYNMSGLKMKIILNKKINSSSLTSFIII